MDLDQDAKEDINLGDDLLILLLGAVLGWLDLAIDIHLSARWLTKGHALAADGNEKTLGNVARGDGGGIGIDNSLCDDIGREVLADKGDGSQGSEGESGVKENDCTV